MQILFTILYALLFIFCLSVLIVIHELGHLIAAKSFNVYCNEFSIGFGPKIFSHRRRNGETYFSMRWIPFGGYVSMYGEGMPLPDGKEIPPERSINGIKKWKRAIILGAGVFMNALLALTVFVLYEGAFEKTALVASVVDVVNDESIASKAGLTNGKNIVIYETNKEYVYGIDGHGVVNYKDGGTEEVYVVLDGSTIGGYDQLSWGYYLHFCYADADYNISFDEDKNLKITDQVVSVVFKVNEQDENAPNGIGAAHTITLNTKLQTVNDQSYYGFEDPGILIHRYDYRLDNFGKVVQNTFIDFGESSVAIVKGFINMFTTVEGFKQAGGIIAIANETTKVLKNFGFANFLRVWGMISVNLAIVNLFPFPGLDGWQLLVLLVEGIAHKEIPQKVKSIMSLIGIGLLFLFMIVLLFKDAFTYFIF